MILGAEGIRLARVYLGSNVGSKERLYCKRIKDRV
jgi:hypothetical protein